MSIGERSFDVIIVGAGAAGCVLAARLSEQADRQVLLLEAGADAAPGEEHPHIRDPFPVLDSNPRFLWPDLNVKLEADGAAGPGRCIPYIQGRGVGGSSNVNGMAADRGLPEDYEEWRRAGASGWGWREVLPYFCKLEHDLDFAGSLHGREGPIPVRRVVPEQWAPFSAAVAGALQRRGFERLRDFNADFRDGVGAAPMNCLPEQRISASMAYLTREVRRRTNLTLVANALAERIDIGGGRAGGVVVRTADGTRTFRGREIIVACGALQSPALLMRSGLGPAASLAALGIKITRDLPGVGRNLQNHFMVGLPTHLPSSSMQPASQRPWLQGLLRYSSQCAGCSAHDMLLIAFNRVAWHPLGRHVGALLVELHKPYSRGTVELARADPGATPRVCFNLLADPRDLKRLVGGLRLLLDVMGDREVMRARNEVFLPNGAMVARLSQRGAWNWWQAWAIARLFDLAPLRKRLLGAAAVDVAALARDEERLRQLVRLGAAPVYHVCGTCRMGSADSQGSVVDPGCRVIGIEGLRVVDASVFPTIPSGGLHLPVMMTAEKMAEQIKAEWRERDVPKREP